LIRDKHTPEEIEAARKKKQKANKQSTVTYPLEIAKAFIKDAEKCADRLDAILQRFDRLSPEDTGMYMINTHAMKSALANVGENDLSTVALRLEQAAKNNDLSSVEQETHAFIAELRAVIEKLRPADNYTHAEMSTEDKLFLRESWRVIKNACLEYDKRTIKDAIAKIKEKSPPRDVIETLDTVSEHLLHSDFEEAAAIAENEANKLD
jgi:HPt (histidine-containing phosphotransfer) domain-containing protein